LSIVVVTLCLVSSIVFSFVEHGLIVGKLGIDVGLLSWIPPSVALVEVQPVEKLPGHNIPPDTGCHGGPAGRSTGFGYSSW
jgi:hypothetical protein